MGEPTSTGRRTVRSRLRVITVGLGAAGVLAGPPLAAHALDPNTTDARAIAHAVEARDTGDRIVSSVTFTVSDSAGRKRVRKTVRRSLEFADGTKSLIFFESPADVRDTGLLSIDYDDGNKEDDQWLYLPSLHRATRIATSDKSGSFMGTDISYSDMTKKDTRAYDYQIVEKSVKIGDEDCWLLEARPKTDKEKKETGYVKTQAWVSKAKLMPVQVKAWVAEGKKLKYLKFGRFEQVEGIWIARQLAVRTVRNDKVESETLMTIDAIKLSDPSVTEAEFTERRLEQGL